MYDRAISETLDKTEVTDFDSFSDYLLEYYGITAKNTFCNAVEYSSAECGSKRMITNFDIREHGGSGYGYDMYELEMFFSSNRELKM